MRWQSIAAQTFYIFLFESVVTRTWWWQPLIDIVFIQQCVSSLHRNSTDSCCEQVFLHRSNALTASAFFYALSGEKKSASVQVVYAFFQFIPGFFVFSPQMPNAVSLSRCTKCAKFIKSLPFYRSLRLIIIFRFSSGNTFPANFDKCCKTP